MIPDVIAVALIPLSGVLAGLWALVRRNRQDFVSAQQDRLLRQIDVLTRDGQDTDERLDKVAEQLQKSREAYLGCVERTNDLTEQLRQALGVLRKHHLRLDDEL